MEDRVKNKQMKGNLEKQRVLRGRKKNKIISVIYSETGYIYKITHTLKSIFLKS